MSIAINDVSRIDQYTASGSQTQFTVSFPFLEDGDIKAYQRATGTTGDDTTDILTITTDYTLAGAGAAGGGTLTLTSGATAGDVITIVGDDPVKRSSYYTTNPTVDGFNEDFEKQTIFNRLNETLRQERMPHYQNSESITTLDTNLPKLTPSTTWRLNDAGTELQAYEYIEASTAAPRDATYITQTSDSVLEQEQALDALATGFMKSTTGTGVVSTVTTVELDEGGTGIDASAATNGQLYVGGTSSNDMQLSTLTATSNQTTITNGTNSITVGTVQDIGAGNSPTFAGMTLSGLAVDGLVTTTAGVISSVSALTADEIIIDNLTGTAYTDIQDVIDFFGSAGYIEGGAVTDNGDGTIDIALGDGFVRTTDSVTGRLRTFRWPATPGLTMTDGTCTFVYVDYNSGVPQVATTGSCANIDHNTQFELYTIVREGIVLHIADHKQLMRDIPSQLQIYLHSKNKIERADADGGLILGESADTNRYVEMSGGKIWIKLDSTDLTSKDTNPGGAADTFDSYYDDGASGWTKTTGNTQWNNTQIDDGSGALLTMTNNRYAAQYFYIDADDELVHLYGQAQHVTLAGVRDESPPSSVPPRLESHALLIGRILFQKSDTTAQDVESAFDVAFSGSLVTDHSNLSGLTTTDAGHTQFALLAGRSGGQVLIGGTDANDDITLQTTSDATKGDYIFTELTTNGVAKIDGSGILTVSAQLELADGGTEIDASGATDGQLYVGGTASNDMQLATLTAGTGISVVNGTNTVTVSATGGGAWVFLDSETASASASIVFNNTYITDTYDMYKILFYNVVPATDGVTSYFQVSTDNGSTWKTGASDYGWENLVGATIQEDTTSDFIRLGFSMSNSGGINANCGEFLLQNPTDASLHTRILGSNSNNATDVIRTIGYRATAEDNDAIRFIMSAGNITSGVFVLYGIKTS